MMCCVTADTSSRRTQCRLLVACCVTLDGDGCNRRAFDSTASRACGQWSFRLSGEADTEP